MSGFWRHLSYVEPLDNSMVLKPSGKQQVDVEPLDNPVVVKSSGKRRFGQPQSEKDIKAVKESRVTKKTLQNIEWAQSIWRQWATHRLEQPLSAESCGFGLDSDITKMSTPAVNHWLQRFVIEVRKVSALLP